MIKNYTSQVSAAKSIAHIQKVLVESGAIAIQVTYDDKRRVSSICFVMLIEGREMPFKLPSRVDQCEQILIAKRVNQINNAGRKKIAEQAERTAWKNISDWVDAQMALIELSQLEVMEVFFPYLYNVATDQTVYQSFKENKFKGLLPAGAVD